ncbi:MAG: hypothetical protein ACOC2V_00500 [Alkalispirochaeta sp.]
MAEAERADKPNVLLPYAGPEPDPDLLDVFVYLRPETNGVAVESTILKVIRECKREEQAIDLVYLANVPGKHIVRNDIVERHYQLRLFFAVHGGNAFTSEMCGQFTDYYREPFDRTRVIGAFEALRRFEWTPEELFALWVDEDAVTRVAGQVVKRYDGVWIVNYDIPALLHKNTAETDIAVMIFRTPMGYPRFFELAGRMRNALVREALLKQGMPIARAAHISRSPFEQLLDARDYLFTADGNNWGLPGSSFAGYLQDQGIPEAVIRGLLEHPVCTFDFGVGDYSLQNLLDLCEGFSYRDGRHIIDRIVAQAVLPKSWSVGASLPS